MVTLKQLVDKENNEMKERRKTETSGCYFVFYIPVAIYMFSSALQASHPSTGNPVATSLISTAVRASRRVKFVPFVQASIEPCVT